MEGSLPPHGWVEERPFPRVLLFQVSSGRSKRIMNTVRKQILRTHGLITFGGKRTPTQVDAAALEPLFIRWWVWGQGAKM